jgi:hypothetical protein
MSEEIVIREKTPEVKEEKAAYRGKSFTLPVLSKTGVRFRGHAEHNRIAIPHDEPVIQDLNKPFDLQSFKRPRKPVSLGKITKSEMWRLAHDQGAPRVLDLPIKFPGSEFRIPKELAAYASIIKRVADYEAAVNPSCYDEYYCYLTVDMGMVVPGTLQREAPCHVDGFQGARWNPKVRNNHTYTVANAIPTAYYVQPFDFDALDDTKHDFFWEMNRQVALTNSEFAWQPEAGELTLMDCYCVHRGTEATEPTFRTFVRISFEARIFDRLGNAHNPMFQYDWEMVPRDIEALNLVAFDETSDPSLRVFPHQKTDGTERDKGAPKTKPNLRPGKAKSDLDPSVVLHAEAPKGRRLTKGEGLAQAKKTKKRLAKRPR